MPSQTTKKDRKWNLMTRALRFRKGSPHHNKKKLEAADHRKIVNHILDKELDPSGILIDVVKDRHKRKTLWPK